MKIKVGISSCLLGERVRYNAEHKYSKTCAEDLAQYFELVPFCPEVGIGLGVPRKPISLVGDANNPSVAGIDNYPQDIKQALQNYAREILQISDLCGYIFMQRSPSCGVYNVKVFDREENVVSETGTGVYAQMICETMSDLPYEESARLDDPKTREAFIKAVRLFAEQKLKKSAGEIFFDK